MIEKGKIIVLDYGIFLHRAIFAWRKIKNTPPEYICLSMITSALRKIGIEPYDTIIVACDGKGNWRKDYEKEYKANRKEYRDKHEDVNWGNMYEKFNNLLNNLEDGTDWHIVKLDKIEADDIASVACRVFIDRDIILVSYDKDWELLWKYPNVKIFSILKKYKGRKGAYKIPSPNFDAYTLLGKKIKKEVSDNLVNPVLTEEDYDTRKLIVSLLSLPEFVERPIQDVLKNLKKEKPADINFIPFKHTIRKQIANLYNEGSKIVTYEECLQKELKKKKKKRKKSKK